MRKNFKYHFIICVTILVGLVSSCSTGIESSSISSKTFPTDHTTNNSLEATSTSIAPSAPSSALTTNTTGKISGNPGLVESQVGLNIYLYGLSDKLVAQTIGWLKDLKVGWVRLPLYWNEIETIKGQRNWQQVDPAINILHQAGIRILLNAIHCPAWAALNPQRPGMPRLDTDFADFMSDAASRYKGKVEAYEIWNEPNLEREAGKPVQAGPFVELLKAGYIAVKKADPAALVVTGGLTPTGVNNPDFAVDDVLFLKQFYAYHNGEVKNYYDVLGAHPGNSQNPPDTLWPDQPGPGPGWRDHPSFYFRRVEQLRQVMLDNGEDAKQIWFTEFGWASNPHPASGFGFAAQVSEEQQGQYLARALAKGSTEYHKWVGQMFIFQLNMALPEFTPDPNDERIAWGLIRRDGSKRPAYFAIQKFISGGQ